MHRKDLVKQLRQHGKAMKDDLFCRLMLEAASEIELLSGLLYHEKNKVHDN